MAQYTETTDPGALSMEEIYNLLMERIEPELCSDVIGRLPELYRDETPEQRTARAVRYAHAFKLFEEEFSALMEIWRDELLAFKHQALMAQEQQLKSDEQDFLDDFDGSLKTV